MFSFDPKSRILKVQKIPESELELNLLEYQRESYNKYVTETVYNDMQYLVQAMRDSLQVSQVEAEFRVEDLYRGSYKREVKKQSPSLLPCVCEVHNRWCYLPELGGGIQDPSYGR